jgi:glycosyltransferase involved in cell wall biosynthesis
MRSEIEQQITTLGLSRSVAITGWLASPQVDIELSTAWAVVAPSLWAEPFGIAAIEAIMRGIPVVASDSGGLAENIENDVTGLLFTPGDESSLTQALRRVAMRTVFRAGRIEPEAVERSRARFSLDTHVERMRNVFLEMM